MCFNPLQCLLVGAELYLANKLTANVISCLVVLARYISAPIALRYDLQNQEFPHPFLKVGMDLY